MISLNTYFTVTREIQTFNVRSNHAFYNSIYNLFRPVHLSQTFLTEDYGDLLYYKGFHHQNVINGLPSLSIYFLTNNAPAERLINLIYFSELTETRYTDSDICLDFYYFFFYTRLSLNICIRVHTIKAMEY